MDHENSGSRLDDNDSAHDSCRPPTNESLQDRRPVLVLVNPQSGTGKSVSIYKKILTPFLDKHNVAHDVFITESDFRIKQYLHSKSLKDLLKYKSIIVVSGDGLFHETVNALMSREDWEKATNVPIGIVPAGSGNGLAYTLIRQTYPNLKANEDVLEICCEQAIQDESCLVDLVKITFNNHPPVWSFLSFGWGLISDIDVDSDWLRRLGEFRFTAYGLLRSLTSVSYSGRLSFKSVSSNTLQEGRVQSELKLAYQTDNKVLKDTEWDKGLQTTEDGWTHIEDKFACIYAVYQKYISRTTNFSPNSTLTDQLIYLTYIRGYLSPCQAVEFMLAIKDGSHDKLPYIEVVPVTRFTLEPLERSKIVVDGEIIPWNLSDGKLSAQVVPQAMKLSWKSRHE